MRLIYLSPVPWASFSQRSHHFVNWYHRQTAESVLWIDPYPTRLPSLNDFRNKRPVADQHDLAQPSWLRVCKPKSLPIEPIPGSTIVLTQLWRDLFKQAVEFASDGPCMVVVGKPSVMALQLLARLPDSYAVYDAMDDFPAFYQGISRWSMARREEQLVRRVSTVLVSSTTLKDAFSKVTDNVELALNACDMHDFAPVEALDLSAKQRVLGYVGTVGQWFDWDLVIKLAQANPDNPVQLVGPLYVAPPCVLPANIELLPERDHPSAIAAMAKFSVGLIPFKLNRLTASVDPIKYYEYRALGLSVISTRFGEMAQRCKDPGVWIVDEGDDLRKTALEALASPTDHSSVRQFRQDNLWMNRFCATQVLTQVRAARAKFELRGQ